MANSGPREFARWPGFPGVEERYPGGMEPRVISRKKHRIEIDTASLCLRLHMPEPTTFGGDREPEIVSTPRDVDGSAGFVSASMLALKCKQVDDRLYAAVEHAAQGGSDGKRALLLALGRRLAAQAPARSDASDVILAAVALGGNAHRLEGTLSDHVSRLVAAFLANPLASKPIGFYNDSEELTAIFRQDRMLQMPLPPEDAALVARALHADPALRAIYERTLALVERLTNPFARADLRPILAAIDRGEPVMSDECSFFPPSSAHETELMKQLFADREIPEDFDLADEIIRRVQSGALSFTPRPQSGWYDHQTWATEPLLLPSRTPEAARLRFDEGYRKQLRELWKGIVALQRETHIKQLEIPMAGGGAQGWDKKKPAVYVRPDLTLEPTCEHYRRRVLSYRFVRAVLTQAFGAANLGPSLTQELDAIESLCAGAYASGCSQIGLPPDPDVAPDPEEAIAAFARFRDGLSDDPDLGRDARMMVPVFQDGERGKIKVWVFLGWAAESLTVSFDRRPRFQVLDEQGRSDPEAFDVFFVGESHPLVFPVTAEVYVSEILDRAEFRKLCDTHRTRSAILANLR